MDSILQLRVAQLRAGAVAGGGGIGGHGGAANLLEPDQSAWCAPPLYSYLHAWSYSLQLHDFVLCCIHCSLHLAEVHKLSQVSWLDSTCT